MARGVRIGDYRIEQELDGSVYRAVHLVLPRRALLKISRVRMGGLSFEGLAMGGWRDLTKSEIADLRKRAGLA